MGKLILLFPSIFTILTILHFTAVKLISFVIFQKVTQVMYSNTIPVSKIFEATGSSVKKQKRSFSMKYFY